MARLWSAGPPRNGGPRGARAPVAAVALALLLAALVPASDVNLYRTYGAGFLHHRLPAEYPALAGFIFTLPRLLPLPYGLGFSLLMALALIALLQVGRRTADGAVWTERFLCYLVLGTLSVVLTRFDVLPALAVLLAVKRARAGRWSPAWAWAVVGTLLKLFPVLLLPGFALAEWRATRRFPWRRLAATAGVLGAWGALQQLLVPGTLLHPLAYETHRGFEFSSVPGSLSLLLAPMHLGYGFAFGNHEVWGPAHATVAGLMTLLAVGGVAAVWALAARGRLPVEATSLAVLSVAVMTDRALAPQYLLWLAPLWAYWRLRPSWLAAAGLTTLVFPVLFMAAGDTGSLYPDTVVAALRNALLIGGTAAWMIDGLRTQWGQRATAPTVPNEEMEVLRCPAPV